MNLLDRTASYIIISAYNNNSYDNEILTRRLDNVLESMGYITIDIDGFYNGSYEKSFLAYKDQDNKKLRMDAVKLMGDFHQENIIIKYENYNIAHKLFNDARQIPLNMVIYNGDSDTKSYLFGTQSFTFIDCKNYKNPSSKDDFKTGSIIEYLNNNNEWTEKVVIDVDKEYENLYKILIKYEKVRIPV